MRNTLLIIGIILFSLINPSHIRAEKLIFNDNFNDGDFSDWMVVRNSQWGNPSKTCMNNDNKANWHINNGALGIDINGPGCVTEIIPTIFTLNGISNYRYEFDWNFRSPAGGDHNVIFLWKDKNNWYDFKVTGGTIWLQKVINGRVYWLNPHQAYYPFQANINHHVVITVKNNVISLKIDGNNILQTTDHKPFIQGNNITLGLQASVGSIPESHSYFDNIRVYDLDAEDDNLIYKQTDDRWKDKVYDHATNWSNNPTIKRWGCALTSAAMLLRHYNINNLPPGDNGERLEINPETLNSWLNNQPDGYLGEGLVNWIALTRLTRLVNQLDSTDKLEYRYLPITDQEKPYQEAINELENNRWTIAQIPKHFLVVHGTNDSKDDLAIYDPYYDFNWMSQHKSNGKDPISYRQFVPSHTDLSYLLFAYPSGIELKVFNSENTDVTDDYKYTEQISASDNNKENQLLNIIAIPKPETGNFSVQLSSNTEQKANITIFAYDNQANLTNLSQNEVVLGFGPVKFNIDYHKDNSSQINRVLASEDELLAKLDELSNQNKLPWFINFWLRTYLETTASASDSFKSSYYQLTQKLIDHFRPRLDNLVYAYLKQLIPT